MPLPVQRADHFDYVGYVVDEALGAVTCTYETAGHTFSERYVFGPHGDWTSPAVEAAVRMLFLLAGVSYYKTTAAHRINLGLTATTPDERAFLRRYFLNGLAEFSFRNGLNLQDLEIVGPDGLTAPTTDYVGIPGRPLIPFGGGIDSIVTVDAVRAGHPDAALCVVHPPGDRFAAIETAALATGLPIIHIERALSPLVRQSDQLAFFNGHVPITAIITAAAVVAAVLHQRDAVVLSNEQSASVPTLMYGGQPVNHQWSKGAEFEREFAELVRSTLGGGLAVFSYLRCRSELWVAQEFARLTGFHGVFRSCNRSFHQDPSQRLDLWCGTCDKCCFIDLILAPFMPAGTLRTIFNGQEPLENPELEHRFRALLSLTTDPKPFECVGDVEECRTAVIAAAARPDRLHTTLLHALRDAVTGSDDPGGRTLPELLAPLGPHYIPDGYAPPDLLARAR
jgi:UDP-N-acetyl-alpha-D-muramoyl-L-alanyl-L-glutamate epimerase